MSGTAHSNILPERVGQKKNKKKNNTHKKNKTNKRNSFYPPTVLMQLDLRKNEL